MYYLLIERLLHCIAMPLYLQVSGRIKSCTVSILYMDQHCRDATVT